jgi:hypothetical protein
MRKGLLLGLAVLVMVLQGDRGFAQRPIVGGTFFGPSPTRRVTISQHGTTVGILTFPTGVLIDTRYTGMPPITNNGRWVFKGDFQLRARPATAAPGQAQGPIDAQIMADAPFVLNMKDADVLIENAGP